MGSLQSSVVLATLAFLVFFTGYASAIKCHMCNSRMGAYPNFTDCKNNADYHSMDKGCPENANRCLRLIGHHMVFNKTVNAIASNFNGTVRDCGTPTNLAIYFPTGVIPKDGCYDNQSAVNRTIDRNGNLTFTGTICLCSTDNCNAAYRMELSSMFLLFLTVVAVYGSH